MNTLILAIATTRDFIVNVVFAAACICSPMGLVLLADALFGR